MQLDRTEARVLGALVEKRWTVPDQYPLSMNALVAACNQKSNREPVLELAEFEIAGCLLGLRQRGLVMVHEQVGGRVPRYSEKFMEELRISRQEIGLLAELLLRGPQTAGELYRRCGRMAHYDHQGQVDALLRELAGGRFVQLLPREPGQRFPRWRQLLSVDRTGATAPDDTDTVDAPPPPREPTDVPGPGRVAPPTGASPPTAAVPRAAAAATGPIELRGELSALRSEVDALRRRVAALEAAAGRADDGD